MKMYKTKYEVDLHLTLEIHFNLLIKCFFLSLELRLIKISWHKRLQIPHPCTHVNYRAK